MEYQKIANLLDSASNQPSKFRTRNWVEINDESKGKYDNSNIRFKTGKLYAIIVMNTYLLRELKQFQTRQLKVRQKILLIKK